MAKTKTSSPAPVKTEFNPETGSTHIVLPADQQALMDEMTETGAIPEGHTFTPHNAGQPFTKTGEPIDGQPETTNEPPPPPA